MPINKRFLAASLVGAAVTFGACAIGVAYMKGKYVVGVDPQPRNGCAPWTFYWVDLTNKLPIKRGDVVAMRSPEYKPFMPENSKLFKFVAALPGDVVEVRKDRIWVNGEYFGKLWLLGTLKQPFGHFDRKEVVPPGHFLPLNVEPNSFDGRYWGYVSQDRVFGHARIIF